MNKLRAFGRSWFTRSGIALCTLAILNTSVYDFLTRNRIIDRHEPPTVEELRAFELHGILLFVFPVLIGLILILFGATRALASHSDIAIYDR